MLQWPQWIVDLQAPAARGRLHIRLETFGAGFLGGVSGAAVALAALSAIRSHEMLAWFDAHPGAAGWFQAFGAVLAIFVAIGVPAWNAAQAQNRLRSTAYQLAVEALEEVATYLDCISVLQPAWTASEDPDTRLARIAGALEEFPASELAVLGALRSFIAIGVLVRRSQEMFSSLVTAYATGGRKKSIYTRQDVEFLLEELGIMVEELRKDLGLPRPKLRT